MSVSLDIPVNYTAPSFPSISLTWPLVATSETLFYSYDIFRFIFLWTLILNSFLYSPLVYFHPLLFVIGLSAAIITGALTALIVSSFYTSASLVMPTYTLLFCDYI